MSNLRQLETNLNFISSLPARPAMETHALQEEFDRAGNVIKDYINTWLIPDIGASIADCLASAKAYADLAIGELSFTAEAISYDNTTSQLQATNVQDAIDEIKGTVDTVNSTLSGRISAVESTASQNTYSVSASSGASINRQTIVKIGNVVYVQMEGTINIPAGGQSGSICSLPSAIRPSATRYLQAYVTDNARNYGTDAVVVVNSDGSVKINSPYAQGYYDGNRFQIHGMYVK